MTRFRAETKPDSTFIHINSGGVVTKEKPRRLTENQLRIYREGRAAGYEAGKRAAAYDLCAAIIDALGLDERYVRQPED